MEGGRPVLAGLKHQDGGTGLEGVANLSVLEDLQTKVIGGCQVTELHIGFGTGFPLGAELERPGAVSSCSYCCWPAVPGSSVAGFVVIGLAGAAAACLGGRPLRLWTYS